MKRHEAEFPLPEIPPKRQKISRRDTIELEEEAKVKAGFTLTPSMTEPTDPMPLENIIITQNSVRFPDNITKLLKHTKEGGKFQGICLFAYPDNKMFLHDGHHRVIAIYLSGRQQLEPEEYVIINSTYEAMNTVLFEKSYVTPYDPRTEMRRNDFGVFKTEALRLYNEGKEEEAREYISLNRHLYVFPRCISSLKELAATLKMEEECVETLPTNEVDTSSPADSK